MTIEQKLIAMTVERGLFEDQAREIMERVKADESLKSMTGRWDDEVEGHIPQTLAGLWLSTCDYALEWIDAYKPRAFFRSLFVIGESAK